MSLINNTPIALTDVTPELINELKASAYSKAGYRGNTKVLDVLTSRGVSKYVTCLPSSTTPGEFIWEANAGRGWSAANVTKEMLRIFAPEKAKKIDERNQASRKARAMPDGSVKVGSIFAGSFGYDATLWDFFEVVSISATGKTCKVRTLKHETRSCAGGGYMDWECRPVPHHFSGALETKRIDYSCSQPCISVSSYESAYLVEPDKVGKWYHADNYH